MVNSRETLVRKCYWEREQIGTGRLQQWGGRGAHRPAQHEAGCVWEGASLQHCGKLQVPWPRLGIGGSRHVSLVPYCCAWTVRYGWI